MVPAEDLSSGSSTLLTTAVTPAPWRPPQVLRSQPHTYPNTHMHIQITENKNVSFFIRKKRKNSQILQLPADFEFSNILPWLYFIQVLWQGVVAGPPLCPLRLEISRSEQSFPKILVPHFPWLSTCSVPGTQGTKSPKWFTSVICCCYEAGADQGRRGTHTKLKGCYSKQDWGQNEKYLTPTSTFWILFCFVCFEIESHCVAPAGLEFVI